MTFAREPGFDRIGSCNWMIDEGKLVDGRVGLAKMMVRDEEREQGGGER